ncbi:MAG: hypothetical protein QM817_29950 [Archangium sp.]
MATKKKSGASLQRLATIARPNRMGQVAGSTLYLLETKVSDDFLPAFPDATVARIVAWDVTNPEAPERKGSCDVRAAWSFVATRQALYVLLARKIDEKRSVMDLAVLDLSEPLAPKLATTLEDVGTFGSDSKQPVLVVGHNHLVLSTRVAASVEVFDLLAPLAPKKVATVALSDTPQAAFGDERGVLVTFLGNDTPMVELTGSGATWDVRRIAGLGGSELPARLGETIFRATGDHHNELGLFDRDGKQRSATKLGPTSIAVRVDGEHVVTLGDALSVFSADGTLIAKKKGPESPMFSASGGFVLLPQRADAKAEKSKAFAFELWKLS